MTNGVPESEWRHNYHMAYELCDMLRTWLQKKINGWEVQQISAKVNNGKLQMVPEFQMYQF